MSTDLSSRSSSKTKTSKRKPTWMCRGLTDRGMLWIPCDLRIDAAIWVHPATGEILETSPPLLSVLASKKKTSSDTDPSSSAAAAEAISELSASTHTYGSAKPMATVRTALTAFSRVGAWVNRPKAKASGVSRPTYR